MGAAWAIGIGAGMQAGGNVMNAAGTAQSNRAQEAVTREEMKFQRDQDRLNAQRLQQLLDQETADQRVSDTATATAADADAMTEVARTLADARGKVTAAGSESAQGEIIRGMEGVKSRASKTARLLARIRAQRQIEQDSAVRGREYAVDRNRLAGKSASRARLYPLLMNAAAMRGAPLRQAGSATTALGAILMQYGLSAQPTAGGTADPSITAVTEAPIGGWSTTRPTATGALPA